LFLGSWLGTGPAEVGAAPAARQRVISLMPSQTELLFALGFGDRVVGVSDHCNEPAAVRSLPKVGAMELNLERIVGLRPDLIVDLDSMHEQYRLFFDRVGIPYRTYPLRRLDDIASVAGAMAADLGDPAAGTRFLASWTAQWPARVATGAGRLRVYAEIWDSPPQGAGNGSFIAEVIERAGGGNILDGAPVPFPLVSAEEVVRRNPDVILLLYPTPDPTLITRRPGWDQVTAIKRGRIFVLNQDLYVRPGPRCPEAVASLAALLEACR